MIDNTDESEEMILIKKNIFLFFYKNFEIPLYRLLFNDAKDYETKTAIALDESDEIVTHMKDELDRTRKYAGSLGIDNKEFDEMLWK